MNEIQKSKQTDSANRMKINFRKGNRPGGLLAAMEIKKKTLKINII
jgi:hypothetical protein